MPSTYCSDPHLLVYYGHGGVQQLTRFRRVALQRLHYRREDLATLRRAGTEALAYVALSEDALPRAAWHRPERNPWWGGHYVFVSHPEWRSLTLRRAESALERGFSGLFLDTLDTPSLFPGDRAPLLALIAELRTLVRGGYLLANRGLALCDELAPLVDGFVFESFSTTWVRGYRALPQDELLTNTHALHDLQRTGRDLYALDYASTPSLTRFARARAATHGLPSQVSNRNLTRLA